MRRHLGSGLGLLFSASCIVFAASSAHAQVQIVWESELLGDGLVGHTIGVEFSDGEDRSAILTELDFTGSVQQIPANDEDVNLDSEHDNALLDPLYDPDRDSYFLDEYTAWSFYDSVIGGEPGNEVYGVRGFKTWPLDPPPNTIADYSDIAYIVVPADESVQIDGIIGRGAVNYDVSEVIPEPRAALAQLAVIAALHGVARARRSIARSRLLDRDHSISQLLDRSYSI